jgi:hypothetical protein
VDIKRFLASMTICVLFGAMAIAQDANQAAPEMSKTQISSAIKEFSRAADVDGITLSFTLLNNKTVEALFSGNSRYSMRARANTATTFYVQGVSSKDMHFNAKFVIEQDGKKFTGEPISIKNFQDGNVLRGTQIKGLIQLSEKIDVTQRFMVKGIRGGSIEFKLSPTAIELLAN